VIVVGQTIEQAKRPLKKLPTVITSFNAEGYRRYGKDFIDSWVEFWSPAIRLVVYYEGEESDFDMAHGVSWHPMESVEFLRDYLDNLRFPIQHGIVGNGYDINFDARQGRKTFMQVHAARKYGGKVFWIDADVVTNKHVPEKFLDDCLPDDALACYLGRDGWYFTESGFIGFNADHPLSTRFFKNYVHVFIVGSIFAQSPNVDAEGKYCGGGWHDCIAFDCIRHIMGNGPEFVNLAKNVPFKTMHPFVNCAPGEYMVHLKGNRKDTKQLRPGDLAS
jgi:hypothetical protein